MTRQILLVGSLWGSGREVMETAETLGYSIVNIIPDDGRPLEGVETYRWEDLPETLLSLPAFLVVGSFTGNRNQRMDHRWMAATIEAWNLAERQGISSWISIVHPSAHVSPSAEVGRGVFIGPLATVSSRATVADFALLGRGSSLGHDSTLGQWSRLGPGAVVPGNVRIGERAVIGPGATFINGIRLTDGVLVGAGSVVTRHVQRPVQVMGNPARPLRRPLAIARRTLKRLIRRILLATGTYTVVREWYRRRVG